MLEHSSFVEIRWPPAFSDVICATTSDSAIPGQLAGAVRLLPGRAIRRGFAAERTDSSRSPSSF